MQGLALLETKLTVQNAAIEAATSVKDDLQASLARHQELLGIAEQGGGGMAFTKALQLQLEAARCCSAVLTI